MRESGIRQRSGEKMSLRAPIRPAVSIRNAPNEASEFAEAVSATHPSPAQAFAIDLLIRT